MAIAPTPASGAVQQSGEYTVYCCTTMYMYHRSTLSYQGPAVSSGPQKVSGPCRTALWARWSLLLPTGDPPRYRRVRRCVFCPHTQRGGAWALSEPAFRVSPPEDLTNHTYLRSRPRPATCFPLWQKMRAKRSSSPIVSTPPSLRTNVAGPSPSSRTRLLFADGDEHTQVLQESVYRLQMQLNETLDLYKDARRQLDLLDTEKDSMQHLVEELSETVMKHQLTLEDKESRLRQLQHTNQVLESELTASRHSAMEMEKRLDDVSSLIAQANHEKHDQLNFLQAELAQSKEHQFELQSACNAAEEKAQVLSMRAEKLHLEIEAASHAELEAREQVRKLKEEKDAATSEVQSLRLERDAQHDNFQNLEHEIEVQSAECTRLRSELDRLSAKECQAQSRILVVQEEIDVMKTVNQRLAEDSSLQVQAMMTKDHQQTADLEAAAAEIARLQDERNSCRLKMSELEEKVWTREQEASNIGQQLKSALNNVEGTVLERDRLRDELAESRGKVKAIQDDVWRHEKDTHILQTQYKFISTRLESAEKQTMHRKKRRKGCATRSARRVP